MKRNRFLSINLLLLSLLFSGAYNAQASTLITPQNNTGLVGYWSMNEGTGLSTLDASGNSNTGTLTNGAVWTDGKFGRALYFDGSNDYVSIADANSLDVSDLTIAFWFKPAATLSSATGRKDFLVKYLSYWIILNYPSNDGKLVLTTGNGTNSIRTTNTSWTADTWYHFAATISGTTGTIYINGVRNSSGSVDVPSVNASTLSFGGSLDAGTYPNITMDDVRLYSRAITSNEVSRLYQQGSAKRASVNTTGLVGWWRFNERGGTLARDDSGKGNNGTLTGGPVWTTGKYGNGLSFDGVDDYVAVTDNATLNLASSFSVSAWVKLAVSGQDNAIFDSGTQANRWLIQIESTSNKLDFVERAIADNVSSTSLTPGVWQHVVVVKNGDTGANVTFYLNGSSDGTASVGSVTTPSGGKTIGNWTENSEQVFNGSIDDVRIYNRALSAAEVAALYGDTSSGRLTKISTTDKISITSGLLGHWTFDGPEMTTSTSTDASEQGKNGTITGTFTAASGRLGQAFRFNGTNTYIDVNDFAMSNFANGFTWSMWIKTNSFSGTWGWPISGSQGAGVYSYFQCGKIANTGNVRFDTGNFTSNTNLDTTGKNIADGAWHHLVCMWNRTAAVKYIYIDNVLAASTGAAVNNTALDYGHLRLGAHQGPDEYWNGILDDVRVYNRPLNTPEINILYRMGR